jgi:hypothetical protein
MSYKNSISNLERVAARLQHSGLLENLVKLLQCTTFNRVIIIILRSRLSRKSAFNYSTKYRRFSCEYRDYIEYSYFLQLW